MGFAQSISFRLVVVLIIIYISSSASMALSVAPSGAASPLPHTEQEVPSDPDFFEVAYNALAVFVSQIFPATVNNTLPTFPFNMLKLNPQSDTKVKIQTCQRAEIGSCQYYGESLQDSFCV